MHECLVVHLNVRVWSFHAIESFGELLDYNASSHEAIEGDPSVTPLRGVSWGVYPSQREAQSGERIIYPHRICVRQGQPTSAKGCSQIGGVRLLARLGLLTQICLGQSDCIHLANPVSPPLISLGKLAIKNVQAYLDVIPEARELARD